MKNYIEKRLTGEICTIKSENHLLIGRIVEINTDKFFIEILNPIYETIDQAKQIEIRIEGIDQEEVHILNAYIESMEQSNNTLLLSLKPISKILETNKRQYKRLKLEIYKEPYNILIRPFPPNETTNWEKGHLIDISPNGIQVVENNFLSKGQIIEIKIGSPFFEKDLYIVSRVVNRTKENDKFIFSVSFLNISDDNKHKLEKYINNALNQFIKDN